MIPVAEARARILELVAPTPSETVPLLRADGRVLAEAVTAPHAQPPFAASAMDGYALAGGGDRWRLRGESAAGHPFDGALAPGEAVRVFTGAPMPDGADRVLIQEDATAEGGTVAGPDPGAGAHVRPAGGDFGEGHAVTAPRRLGPADVALLAAMGAASLTVRRRPDVAILMTGDEIVPPGAPLGAGRIHGSNGYGLAAALARAGAAPRLLPIARDHPDAIGAALDLAAGADLVVTIGGASVGDRDLMGRMLATRGETTFHKVRMRPGKPLLAGRLDGAALVGLPGNPVSAMVCGVVFVVPAIRAMLGLPPGPATRRLPLGHDVAPNGPREHYMRARLRGGEVHVADAQDSSLLTVLADADVLAIRPPDALAATKGDAIDILDLR